MKDKLSANEILKYAKIKLNINNLILLDTVNSTNLYCKEFVKSNPCHELLVVADTQTKGRGRMDRAFFSPKNTGIYMSLLLDCRQLFLSPNLITIAAGVSVCRVLRNLCKTDAKIKWVNDIFAYRKKVCGILAESVCTANKISPQYIIVGIGINISTPDNVFPDELQSIAGSVFPNGISRNEIIANIISELHYIYMKDSPKTLIDEYKEYSNILGKEITFLQNGKPYTGIAHDINNEGNLIVLLDNNEVITLKSGEVSLGSAEFTKKV